MTDSPVLALAKDLISRPSVTPLDEGCQELMINRLKTLGFEIEIMVFEDTTNFGLAGLKPHCLHLQGIPMLCQLVPLEQWHTPPLSQRSLMVICMVVVLRI